MAETRTATHVFASGDVDDVGTYRGVCIASLAAGGPVESTTFSFEVVERFGQRSTSFPHVHAGAVSPVSLRITLAASDAVPDLSVVQAASLSIKKPNGTIVNWTAVLGS